ncbi:MAG TPA: hypothetical protein VF519_11530 [Mycobacteriales bacterium]|jgi:hypothetical protein
MLLKRAALSLLAVPLLVAAPASAEPIVDGCWGAASATYCDPSLRITPLRGDPSPTPVCAGTCTYVGVPTVEPVQDSYQVCIDYYTPSGYAASECAVDVVVGDVTDLLQVVPALLDRLGCDEPKCGITLADILEILNFIDIDGPCDLVRADPPC